jgi:DNA-binding CsgD family transcriptional regulator
MHAALTAKKEHPRYVLRNAPTVVEAAVRAGIPVADVHLAVERALPPDTRTGEMWHATLAFLAAAERDRAGVEQHAASTGQGLEGWLRGELSLQLAELALADDDPAAAVSHADDAVRHLQRWPGWRRDRADALRRRLDRRVAADGDGELSSRELEVAALLAEGLTNAQLAERLFIARKTAAVHVSNILAKLGMRSRTEVAAWAVRTGVAGPLHEQAG